MDFKRLFKAGYNKIAERYHEDRTIDSQDVRLLIDLISRSKEDGRNRFHGHLVRDRRR